MYDIFNNDDNVLAITTDRNGGVSSSNYSSFNFGYHVGDIKEDVDRNYEILANELNIDINKLFIPQQTHSANFMEITKDSSKEIKDCDALYTKDNELFIGVLTADCLPILLYCPDKQIVAAIHAGWQGSTKLITKKVLEHLIDHEHIDPQLTQAYLAPSIFQVMYEVGDDVYHQACASNLDAEECFILKDNGKYLFDNRLFNIKQLLSCNINASNITRVNKCTYLNKDYFSYRRNKNTGRQLTLIGLNKGIK